jgi:hypothetical protein
VRAVHGRLVRDADRLAGLVDQHDLLAGLLPPASGVGGIEQRMSNGRHVPSVPTPFAGPGNHDGAPGVKRHRAGTR